MRERSGVPSPSPLEEGIREGDNPVDEWRLTLPHSFQQKKIEGAHQESGCLGMQPKRGGKSHLRLNNGERPIANKYREGKMQRTLKREFNRA